MNDIYEAANEARASIGKYCFENCNAYCCRKGYLVLSEAEMKSTVGDKYDLLMNEDKLKKLDDGTYSLNFSNSTGGCPSLNSNMCTIYDNENRSSTCREFPIFIHEDSKKVHLSNRCPAIQSGMMYPFTYEFKRFGYDIK